jgi:hypothetical protein
MRGGGRQLGPQGRRIDLLRKGSRDDERGLMTSAWRRLLPIAAVALGMLVGPPSVALAGPTLTITSPPNNSISNNQTPSFSRATTDTLDKVTLSIYTGTAPTGPVVQSVGQFPTIGDTWSVGPVETLTSGTYTAQATQAAEQNW